LLACLATQEDEDWCIGTLEISGPNQPPVRHEVADMLFGTFHLPRDRWPKGYGVHPKDVPDSYLAQWVYPFWPRKKKQPQPEAEGLPASPP
jgi:hypothetical protein